MKKTLRGKSDDLVWERLLKIVREIIQMKLKKEVTKNRQGWGFDGQIGVWKDPIEIGDLINGRCLIYIVLWFGLWLSPSSSVDTLLLIPLLLPCSYRHVRHLLP